MHSAPVRRIAYLLLATALAGSASAFAAGASLEDRVQQLEQQVARLLDENAALKKNSAAPAKPAGAAPTAPAAVVVQGKETKLALGGFFHLNAEAGDAADGRFPDNDRFLLRKVRLGVKGSFAEDFDFTLQADFGANTLASAAAYRVQATDVFVVWKAHPAANITIGQFKTPFGYEQLLPEVKTTSIERSLVSDTLTLGRQTGAMLAGVALDKKLTYAAAITNGLAANNSVNDNEQFAFSGRVGATVFDAKGVKLSLGADTFHTRDTGTFTGRRDGEGADAQLSWGHLDLGAEYLRTNFDRDTGSDYHGDGWSAYVYYFLVPNRWQLLARYETFDPSDLVGGDRTSLRTLGFNYLIKGDDLKLSLNYLIGNPPNAPHHLDRLIARLQVIY